MCPSNNVVTHGSEAHRRTWCDRVRTGKPGSRIENECEVGRWADSYAAMCKAQA